MDKQTEEICNQGAKETPKEEDKPLGKRKSYPCPPSWLQNKHG